MKKIIIALAFMTFGLTGVSYAATTDNKVPARIETEFSQQFTHAIDVRWEEGNNYFKATFEDWGRTLFAFYSGNGELMGVATNLSTAALPARLQKALKNSYADYWITDLFRYHNADEKGYVVTLENADKRIVLQAEGDDDWTLYKTTVKN